MNLAVQRSALTARRRWSRGCAPRRRPTRDFLPLEERRPARQTDRMARPTTKDELLVAAAEEFDGLCVVVAGVSVEDRTRPGACEAWSVKDVLAHLDAWHEMFLGWEAAGGRGEKLPMPAPGFSWAQTPALNESIYQRHANDAWDLVKDRLDDSHARVVAVITGYDEADLFTKKRFAWTGSTSVASYAISATSSHYAWAHKLIKKWAKTHPA